MLSSGVLSTVGRSQELTATCLKFGWVCYNSLLSFSDTCFWETMKLWNSVVIYGVGLIGGSIGMAIRQRGLAKEVVGVGRNTSSLDLAIELGAIDRYSVEIEPILGSADLVVVATPVGQIVDHIRQVREGCSSDCLITDAGSTKTQIVRQIEQMDQQPEINGCYIGSHPLAGSEQSGVAAASPNLLKDRLVVLTPTESSPSESLKALQSFWQSLGARVQPMSPEDHDEALAQTSHLTHIVASSLAASTPEACLPLAATGWQDTTRIAAGDANLWAEILMQNRGQVQLALQRFQQQLSDFNQALNDSDMGRLRHLLTTGKQRRDSVGN